MGAFMLVRAEAICRGRAAGRDLFHVRRGSGLGISHASGRLEGAYYPQRRGAAREAAASRHSPRCAVEFFTGDAPFLRETLRRHHPRRLSTGLVVGPGSSALRDRWGGASSSILAAARRGRRESEGLSGNGQGMGRTSSAVYGLTGADGCADGRLVLLPSATDAGVCSREYEEICSIQRLFGVIVVCVRAYRRLDFLFLPSYHRRRATSHMDEFYADLRRWSAATMRDDCVGLA